MPIADIVGGGQLAVVCLSLSHRFHPYLLGVPIVGRNQPRKQWMWYKRAKNGSRWVKLGEKPKLPYPQCESSIKIPVFKQQ